MARPDASDPHVEPSQHLVAPDTGYRYRVLIGDHGVGIQVEHGVAPGSPIETGATPCSLRRGRKARSEVVRPPFVVTS